MSDKKKPAPHPVRNFVTDEKTREAIKNGQPVYFMRMGWVEDALHAKCLEIYVQPGTYHLKCMSGTFHEPFRMNEGWKRPARKNPIFEFAIGETEYDVYDDRDITAAVSDKKSVIYGFVIPEGFSRRTRIKLIIHWISEDPKTMAEQVIHIGIAGIQKTKCLKLKHNVRTLIEFYINENEKQLETI